MFPIARATAMQNIVRLVRAGMPFERSCVAAGVGLRDAEQLLIEPAFRKALDYIADVHQRRARDAAEDEARRIALEQEIAA